MVVRVRNRRWQELEKDNISLEKLLEAHGDTSDVPDAIGDFVPWLVDNLQTSRRTKRNVSSEDAVDSGGMGKQAATRLATVFREIESTDQYAIKARTFATSFALVF